MDLNIYKTVARPKLNGVKYIAFKKRNKYLFCIKKNKERLS